MTLPCSVWVRNAEREGEEGRRLDGTSGPVTLPLGPYGSQHSLSKCLGPPAELCQRMPIPWG